MRSKIFDIAKFLIGWPISVISIIFLLKFIPTSFDAISKVKNVNVPVLILSLIFFQFYFFLRGVLWQEILKQKGHKLTLKNLLFLWSFSELKRYAPGNIWSFLGRMFLFNKQGIDNKTIFKSLFYESQFITISGFLVSLLSLNFLFTNLSLPSFKYSIFSQPLIVLFIISLVLGFVFNKKLIGKQIFPNFKPLNVLYSVLISSLSLLCFGIGTYFAGASIYFLDPYYFLGFSGFFVFALLIGYLSIITPMGLGVREGVITIVLSKIMPLPSAIFISIFSRAIFVVSEIIFLFFSWIIYTTKSKLITKVYSFLSSHKEESLLFLCVLLYFIYFTTASFLKYDAFFTGRFDLGNMDQTSWNTIHGRVFQLTDPNGTDTISRLAFHADFILILISPLYLLWSNPKMLLLLQTAVVCLGAGFIYMISKEVLRKKSAAFIFAICFLLNPALQYSNLYDFHPVVLATTFLLASFYFLIKKRYFLLILFLILAGLCKENIWIIDSLFGIYMIIFDRKKLLGLMISLISALLFVVLVWTVIPKFAGSQHFALSYYSDFGDTPTKIVTSIITSPVKTLSTIFQKDQLIYLQQLFQPLGFLPIFAPAYLIFSMPSLLIDLLSNNSQLHKIYYQYSASITPFLFIATIYSVRFLVRVTPRLPLNFYVVFLLLSTLISTYNFGPLIGSKNPNVAMFTEPLENEKLIDNFIQRIPKRYSVAATNEVGSHLSRRQKIYTLPLGVNEADVIVLYSSKSFNIPLEKTNRSIINKLTRDNNYFLVYQDYEFVVFKKKGLKRSFFYF